MSPGRRARPLSPATYLPSPSPGAFAATPQAPSVPWQEAPSIVVTARTTKGEVFKGGLGNLSARKTGGSTASGITCVETPLTDTDGAG